MEALTSLSTKIFTKNTNKAQSPSRSTLLGRSDIGFSRSSSFKKVHFDHLILFRRRDAPSVTKSHVASNAEVLTGFEPAESGIQKIGPSKTAHVKFQLQKECMFGDQFLLVGDDPMIGLWDPSSAIPLNWSDGHIWSVELDVCTDLTIQFKFILKRSTGEIFWQPGPDRTFKTWESKNTIVVAEDWENAEAQKIMEEQVINQIEELLINPELEPIVAENLSHQREELMYDVSHQIEELVINPELEPILTENVSHQREELMPVVNKDVMFSGNIAYAEDKSDVNIEFIRKENVTYPVEGHLVNANKELESEEPVGLRKEDPTKNNNQRTLTGKNPLTVDDEETLFGYEEKPVLIPGLTPLQVVSAEEALSKELGSIIADASVGVDTAKDQNVPELTS